MEKIDQLGMVQSIMDSIAKKKDEILLIGLKKAGYDISDPVAIAKRCTVCKFEETRNKELWVDYNTPEAKLIGLFDDGNDLDSINSSWHEEDKKHVFTFTFKCTWMGDE